MKESKKNFGSDFTKVDAHVITPKEHQEIPEWTDEMFEAADLYHGDTLIRRGRPRSATPKQAIKLRLDAEILAAFRATGKSWQTRINDALREWLGKQG